MRNKLNHHLDNSPTFIIALLFCINLAGCFMTYQMDEDESLQPKVITEKVNYDTDDPAIWVHPTHPEQSIIFGTDKETDGAIFAFDLEGKIIADKVIRGVNRPNNIDLEPNVKLLGKKMDLLVFTERGRSMIRVYSVPNMRPMDRGGFKVFQGEPEPYYCQPMGIAIYTNPKTDSTYVIVGRKSGPQDGTYLWQYALTELNGHVSLTLRRKFGQFSGIKEIEAIAVDDELGFVYYADEGAGIHKYHADPARGNEELAFFGTDGFKDDIEGIAVLPMEKGKGFLIVSDQQAHALRIFRRTSNEFVKSIPYMAMETDGLEVTPLPLGEQFPRGLLVAMSDDKTFHYYDLATLELE